MKIIDRYMSRNFLGPFIWCVLVFITMAIIIDIFSFIDDIVNYKIPLTSLIRFYAAYTPTIAVQIIPMAVLLSTISALSNLNKHSEIIAMKSGGMSLWRILAPILVLGLVISSIVFVINDKVIPSSSRIASTIRHDELEKEKNKEKRSRVIENVAVYDSNNKIIFARKFDAEARSLEDIIIHEQDDKEHLTAKITAERGVWNGDAWRFFKVITYRMDNSGHIIGSPVFVNEAVIQINEKPSDFQNNDWQSEYMSYRELKLYIERFKNTDTKLIRNLKVDMHYKISFCLISFVIILTGAPFALITTRGGVLIGVGVSITIGLLYYAVIAIALAIGKNGLLPPVIAAWISNVIFALFGAYLIQQRT